MTGDSDQTAGEPDLARLLTAAAAGDEQAWRALVELYGRRIYALAKSRLRGPDVAEEIAQSVFVTVSAKLADGGYTEQGRFEAWLFRIAMNRIRDEVRRRARVRTSVTDQDAVERIEAEAEPAGSGPERGLAELREAMARLSDADREIIELRHHGQMSFRDIADLLGEPLGTLLARHHRALRKLRTIMSEASADA